MPKFLKFLLLFVLALLAIPIVSFFFPSSDSKKQDTQQEHETTSETQIPTLGTIVIDAGHGGHQ